MAIEGQTRVANLSDISRESALKDAAAKEAEWRHDPLNIIDVRISALKKELAAATALRETYVSASPQAQEAMGSLIRYRW
jgi:hypothetical protein